MRKRRRKPKGPSLSVGLPGVLRSFKSFTSTSYNKKAAVQTEFCIERSRITQDITAVKIFLQTGGGKGMFVSKGSHKNPDLLLVMRTSSIQSFNKNFQSFLKETSKIWPKLFNRSGFKKPPRNSWKLLPDPKKKPFLCFDTLHHKCYIYIPI